ncbi:MAG: hypothetical protein FJ316_06410 [SAR202 cluster bacterium]|nr:hypothetical protein [SAR202 cluster bacterium]
MHRILRTRGSLTKLTQPARDDAKAPVQSSEEVSRRLVAVQEALRREMADYLHGHVQSKLVALSISISLCQKTLRRDPGAAYRMLERIQEELKHIQDEDLRQVSRQLYPAIIKIGLAPALQSLADRFKPVIDLDLKIGAEIGALEGPEGHGLPEKLRLGFYRVAEEALTNILKHAQATKAQVSLGVDVSNRLVLAVMDDGRGFDPASVSAGLGLLGLRDYAQAIGAETSISSTPGKGTTIRLALALPEVAAAAPSPAAPAVLVTA